MTEPERDRWLLTVESGVLEGIGRIAVHFSHLEYELAMNIWSLIANIDAIGQAPSAEVARDQFKAQRIGQAVTMPLLFRHKVQVFVGLATERLGKGPLLDEALSFETELREAEVERNRILHSTWSGMSDLGTGVTVPGVGIGSKSVLDKEEGMRHRVTVQSQENLGRYADSIARLGYRLSGFRRRMFAA